MAGSFVFVQYTGDDAGEVILRVLSGNDDGDEEATEEPKRRIIGFQVEEVTSQTELAHEPSDLEDDGEDEDDDDGEYVGE